MEKLYRQSFNRVNAASDSFYRYLFNRIDWRDRLICIKGIRGSGKTTLLLQYIKDKLPKDNSVIYISLDDIYFTENKLVDFVEDFYNRGGRYLFIDEAHKYKNWSIEIKNIYDNYPAIKVVVTGSSMLEIDHGKSDLSRRLSLYQLHNMSFREFLQYEYSISLPVLSVDDILYKHIDIALEISKQISPLALFGNYLQYGCLPFYKENIDKYYSRLNNIINVSLDTDIASVVSIDFDHTRKLKQILYIVSQSAPFSPNIVKLAEKTGIDRRTVLKYLDLLEKAGTIKLLNTSSKGLTNLAKPEKIYLANTNLIFALANETGNKGNLRETFFLNQLSADNAVNYSHIGDFLVNGKYTFEIGGKNKDFNQIKNIENSFLALDDIATGMGNKIPLWLFGFLY
jgi:predicted AAA+ superfamily ATPase